MQFRINPKMTTVKQSSHSKVPKPVTSSKTNQGVIINKYDFLPTLSKRQTSTSGEDFS